MNSFENPKNIIDRETLENEDKEASSHETKTFREELAELRKKILETQESHAKLLSELNLEIDLMHDNSSTSYRSHFNIFDIQTKLDEAKIYLDNYTKRIGILQEAISKIIETNKITSKN